MNKELVENKKWLQSCQSSYDDLREVCCDVDDNLKVDEVLEEHIKALFPIFNEIPYYSVFFSYQNGDAFSFGGILDRELTLNIEFSKKYAEDVQSWFYHSIYNKYDIIVMSISNSNRCVIFKVMDIINDIGQEQIKDLHKQLAEESYSFLHTDSEDINRYIAECTDDDPYYLGVRFIEYTGKFPIYCDGDVILEIEGEKVVLSAYDVWGGFGFDNNKILENCDLKWYERYRNEIIRVIKENVETICCGGCE